MASGAGKILVYLFSVVMVFFGLLFMVSANLGFTYFLTGVAFLGVAGGMIFLIREKKSLEIKQTLTVTGPLKINEIHCPNCSAIVDATKTSVVDGKPFVPCSYCGNKFELTEEPTW